MDDDIDLPPLLPNGKAFLDWFDDARRAAVLADRERRAKADAKPKVHSTTLSLGQNGSWSRYPPSIHGECATVTLCWTADGRAWIDSERNREQAAMLRQWEYHGAADALDGGV